MAQIDYPERHNKIIESLQQFAILRKQLTKAEEHLLSEGIIVHDGRAEPNWITIGRANNFNTIEEAIRYGEDVTTRSGKACRLFLEDEYITQPYSVVMRLAE